MRASGNLFEHVLFEGTQSANGETRRTDLPAERTALLHRVTRNRLSPASTGFPMYCYEITVWQRPWLVNGFVVILRRRLLYHHYGQTRWEETLVTWRSEFASRQAAYEAAEQVLERPLMFDGIPDSQNSPGWRQMLEESSVAGHSRIDLVEYDRPWGIDDGLLAETVVLGALLPKGPAAGEVVRQLWGREERNARAAVLWFAEHEALRYGGWANWKWLFKQAEASNDVELLAVMFSRLDTYAPVPSTWNWEGLLSEAPSTATFGYLKRRARRYLRRLADRDPESYVDLAVRILLQPMQRRPELDLVHQWISLDIMYGRSHRYAQVGHGTGRYICRQRYPSIVRQDEFVPETWDGRTADLARLVGSEIPWQTIEWACQMLLRRGAGIPELDEAQLHVFLTSGSPLLMRIASETVVSMIEKGRSTRPDLGALAFYYGKGSIRARIATVLHTHQVELPDGMALNLYELWASGSRDADPLEQYKLWQRGQAVPKPSRRRMDAVTLLVRQFPKQISDEMIQLMARDLLATRQTDLQRIALAALARDAHFDMRFLLMLLPSVRVRDRSVIAEAVSRLETGHVPGVLSSCESLPQILRDLLAGALLAQRPIRKIDAHTAEAFMTAGAGWVQQVGLRLSMLPGALDDDTLDEFASNLISSGHSLDALASILGVPDSRELLLRAPAAPELLASLMRNRPEALRLLPLQTIQWVVDMISTESLAGLLLYTGNGSPEALSTMIMALRQRGGLRMFWETVWDAADDPNRSEEVEQTLRNPAVRATFREIADERLVSRAHGVVDTLIVDWMSEDPSLWSLESGVLLTAAVHKEPIIREWALQRACVIGITIRFGLRLLESGLPDCVTVATAYFDRIPRGAADEMDAAIALSDSPVPAVRRFARAYVMDRRSSLPTSDLVRRLAEHPDPVTQAMVAEIVVGHPDLAPIAADFERDVLRSRDRGRRAKELVKRRIDSAESGSSRPDTDTLLDLARGQTSQDAEWALQQLAARAMSGESIEGLELRGPGGV